MVGFGGFQKVETPPPSPGIATLFDIIIFRVYFKRYLYGTLFPFMHFHVDLTYSIFLRNLEEKEANCVKIRDIGEDIEYNCTVPDIEPNKTIEALASKNDYIFNDGEHDAQLMRVALILFKVLLQIVPLVIYKNKQQLNYQILLL